MSAFTSTRGLTPTTLAEAVFRGLAPDGGLYVPVELPDFRSSVGPTALGVGTTSRAEGATSRDAGPTDDVRSPDDVRPVAHWAAPRLFPDLDGALLARVVERALDMPIPLVPVGEGRWVLELFHGPTHAFKDVGARFMAALMAELDPSPAPARTILVATSGDTGGAVASAFHELAGYDVVVLFPQEGVSERQRRQMTTLGGNVLALAVRGSFDDCQGMVKAAFSDSALAARHRLTSANSINVARLLPQAIYYLHAVHRLTGWPARAPEGPPPHFVVPSGNLGNLCAGLIAARAGMPHSGFTAAANENRGFVDFLGGAPFTPRPSVPTSSNAMDVGAPSNLERLRWLFDGDDAALRAAVRGVAVGEADVAACLRRVHGEHGYTLDPHTAVAFEAASGHDAPSGVPTVVLATAHPAKFPETVEAVTGVPVPLPPGLLSSRDRPESMLVVEPTLQALAAALVEAES